MRFGETRRETEREERQKKEKKIQEIVEGKEKEIFAAAAADAYFFKQCYKPQ